jgi:hypothetical protein
MSSSPTVDLASDLTRDDLCFLARATHEVGRHSDAMSVLDLIIAQNPALEQRELILFGAIYKDAIDQIRSTLRVLCPAQASARSASDLTEIQKLVNQSTEELRRLCTDAASLVQNVVLPAAVNALGRVFLHKLIGDMLRYISEYDPRPEYLEHAQVAYLESIRIGDESLSDLNPFKLGTVLNFAVFTNEQLKNSPDAIELVSAAVKRAHEDATDVSPQTRREAISVLAIMESNLARWQDEDGSSEGEPEESE